MNTPQQLYQLQQSRELLLDTIRQYPEKDCKKSYHPDLSPMAWHLGHCTYTESYWIREVVAQDQKINNELRALYIPELSAKPDRASALPDMDDLYQWTEETQEENMACLQDQLTGDNNHHLLRDGFLLDFLTQHYAQHYETTMYVLAQRQLNETISYQAQTSVHARLVNDNAETVPADNYEIGARDEILLYDNEYPAFATTLEEFNIAEKPATVAEYLGFINDDGYRNHVYWSKPGWRWLSSVNATHPENWKQDNNNNWFAVGADGPVELIPDAPVSGINYYEATAFANWAGARLPHEYEWETADKLGLLKETGKVWEWCDNPFHPYFGFRAYPYDGYSLPYFDNNHYVLRGGSQFTRPEIQRTTFRNYYEPDKRHINAGVRFVF